MKTTKVFFLNSFTSDKSGGNGAGVVLGLDYFEKEMTEIARRVGFSETAFVEKISSDEYKIRYFTPAGEVDLCGHATIAAFCFLKQKKLIKNGKYKLNTKAGKIDIFINDIVVMSQKLPFYGEIIDKKEILPCFKNIKTNDFIENLFCEVVSTGLRDIIIPVKNLEILFNLEPCFDEIIKISKKYNTIGLHLFTFETLDKKTAHVRNFAPLYEIPEESATGTSNGALACYFFKYFSEIKKSTSKIDFENLVFEQGFCMKKPSEIFAQLKIENQEIKTVFVGGNAVFLGEKEVISHCAF